MQKMHICTQMAYATFVTSHTLVISKDTKRTRSSTQFSRMQPKWSCTQALSLARRKRTEERNTNDVEKKRGLFRRNTQIFIFIYNVHIQSLWRRCTRSVVYAHINAPLLHPDRNRHNESSVLSTRDVHWNACQTDHLGCIWNNTLCWKYL